MLNNENSSGNCRWHSFDNTLNLEHAVETEILTASQRAINARGAFHVVLAGGTTPSNVYAALRQAKTNWAAWHIYFGDERCLPSTHADRNSVMAASVWLDHVAIPTAQRHPIPAEEDVTLAAEKYARLVGAIEIFDLVLLGLGEDGHTASLFPDHDAGDHPDSPDTLVVLDSPKPPAQRISLSARRLSKTRQLFFLVTGKNKAPAVKDWRSGVPIPATKIKPENGTDIYIESGLLGD
jgi:6-phosphogluconolactonase